MQYLEILRYLLLAREIALTNQLDNSMEGLISFSHTHSLGVYY
jgi:hypothetical protein